jgi:alkylation response protein AidB-like acyl-CoA dehydrogenase
MQKLDLRHSAYTAEACEAFDRLLSKECPPSRVRDSEPLGFDSDLWLQMVALGVPALGVPALGVAAGSGGGGADLRTLSAICEVAGRRLAPVPVADVLAAGRAAARSGVEVAKFEDLLTGLALAGAVGGRAALVPTGAVAQRILGLDDDEFVMVDVAGGGEAVPNLGSMPVRDVDLRAGDGTGARVVLEQGPAARQAHDEAVGEWKLLTAAALVGLAEEALRLGVDYAKERKQFGVPIGTFQALAHRLADDATAVDGARLLVQKAAWTADLGSQDAPALALMAFLFAAETAQKVAADSLHIHGGYGFMAEYDIQLYFRRAKAWAVVAGSAATAHADLGAVLYGQGGSSGL